MNCFAGSRHAVWLQRQSVARRMADDAIVQSLKVVVTVAARLEYLPSDVATDLSKQADETARVLAGFLRSLRSES